MAENLIAINQICLTEVQDPSLSSMHFEIVYNLLLRLPTLYSHIFVVSSFI